MTTNTMRFANPAIVHKAPVVIPVAVLMVALLITWIVLDWSWPFGFWEWLGVAAMIVICPLLVWMHCYSEEIVIDPAARRVTQRYSFLDSYETAKNEWGFSAFTAVRVERKVSKAYGEKKTVYRTSYTLSLLKADTQVTLPDRQLTVTHYPLDLPMEEQRDPLVLEASARQLARLGGWPAKRRGYALLADETADPAVDQKSKEMHDRPAALPAEPDPSRPGWFHQLIFKPRQQAAAELQRSPYIIKPMPHDAESAIDAG